jgi:quercetin dioxygenase-like cupin family protein
LAGAGSGNQHVGPLQNASEPEARDDYGPGPAGWCTKPRRLVRTPGSSLTASVYVLEPGEKHKPYHFHHGAEELLLVLEGTPTLRTPSGERVLHRGDVVHFGAEGAH